MEIFECSRCVMDVSDPKITFDDKGVCNHCKEFDAKGWKLELNQERLNEFIDKVKLIGAGKEYDCILGLSGGVDSSYLALKTKEWGLRPLVFHVDAGWNSELAVKNIQKIIEYCDYDLFTHIVDWQEMKDLQLSYLKSGIANQDVPQDHSFFSTQYKFAKKNNIKAVISGGNLATESVFPNNWHNSALDAISIKDIQKRHGSLRLNNYQLISFFEYYFYFPFLHGLRVYRPLDYIDYNKKEAEKFLVDTIGYSTYGRKHGESVFTKIFQNYILPERFGYDKRKPHLSSLILSGQITREQAKSELSNPLYDEKELKRDILFFCQKLDLSLDEFNDFMELPLNSYKDYKNWDFYLKNIKFFQKLISRILGKELNFYS